MNQEDGDFADIDHFLMSDQNRDYKKAAFRKS